MMTNTKTSSLRLGASLLMVPACVIMLMSFGKKPHEAPFGIVLSAPRVATQSSPDISPVDLTKVTKVVRYGEMMDRRTNKLKNHSGVDLVLSKGSDVVATADGIVIVQAHGKKRGNHVIIKHNDVFSTRYFHLETALVKTGDSVTKGQVIGLVGNTGLSAAPHLHYEILKNDSTVDPKDYLPPLPAL